MAIQNAFAQAETLEGSAKRDFNQHSKVTPAARKPITSPTSAVVRNISLRPQGAVVRPSEVQYESLNLLGLPLDIRQLFWLHIAANLNKKPQRLSTKPENAFAGLLLTCRQIYHELEVSWRRFLIPWNRVHKLLDDVPNAITIRQFRSLTLEIPQDASPVYIKHLCGFLFRARAYLRELRIYFYGLDKYGTKTYAHGCGNLQDEKSELKLPVDGQHFGKYLRLWKVIMLLENLEVIVISNANLQVYQYMLLAAKPRLEYISLTSDPRSTIHLNHSETALGSLLIAPSKDTYPPVKSLNISANAALVSVQIVIRVMESLEHLTWSVPDPSLSSGSLSIPWYRHTAELISVLRLRSYRLKTLRMCIGGAGLYEIPVQYDEMMGSIKTNLKFVQSLRQFEIHCKSKSYWFGEELIEALPIGLTHLYMSDRMIHPYDLLQTIRDQVLRSDRSDLYTKISMFGHQSKLKTRCQHADRLGAAVSISEQLPTNREPWFINIDPVSYDPSDLSYRTVSETSKTNNMFVPRYTDISGETHLGDHENTIVGERLDRRDYISFKTLRLGFIEYEYDHSEVPINPSCSFTPFQAMLYINGRLDDRLRNRHLRVIEHGSCINSRLFGPRDTTSRAYDSETATSSSCLGYSVLLYNLYNVERTHPRNLEEAMSELKDSDFVNDDVYFGREEQAQLVFEDETVARSEDLEIPVYIVEKEVYVDGKCHWSCPDAEILTMSERDERRKLKALQELASEKWYARHGFSFSKY